MTQAEGEQRSIALSEAGVTSSVRVNEILGVKWRSQFDILTDLEQVGPRRSGLAGRATGRT